MPKKPAFQVGDVFAMPQLRGGWSACQVVRVDGRSVEAVALDHRSDERPSLADVTLRAIVPERYQTHKGEPARVHAFDALPKDFVPLGSRPPVLPALPASKTWASWLSLREEAAQEARWRGLPEDARRRYHEGAASHARVSVALPSGAEELPLRTHTVRLAFDDAPHDATWRRIDRAGAFDWRVLDVLPCLTHIAVRGEAPGLLPWLATRPLVNALAWEDFSADTLDLRALSLSHVELHPTQLHTLRLPDGVDQLTLAPRADAPLAVEVEAEGAFLHPELTTWSGGLVDAVRGLSAARRLTLSGFSALDLAAVARAFPRLRELTLRGAPGRVRGSDALAALPSLEQLHTWSCVAFDLDRAPPLTALPVLAEARLSGLCARDVAALRARWGRDRRVATPASIDDALVFAEADFPLLRWPGGQRKGLVCGGYTRAAKAIVKGELTPADAVKALRVFTAAIGRAIEHTGALRADERADVEASWARLTARALEEAPGTPVASVKKTW